MKKRFFVILATTLFLSGLLAACETEPDSVALAPLPTLAATVPLPLPPTNPPATLEPTHTPPPPTETPAPPTETAVPTETSVVSFAATDTPTPTRLPGILPTLTPTAMTPMEIGQGFPGEIGSNEFRIHLVEGVAEQAIFAAVRTDPTVDVGLLIFDGNINELAKESEQSVQDLLITAKADREANFNEAGLMETLAFTPKEDGDVTIVVTSSAGDEGRYRLYAFDAASASPNVVYNQTVELGSEQSTAVSATSNGGKPVVAFINPLDSGLDGQVVLSQDNGIVLTTSNYVGAGLYESAFHQPRTTTGYAFSFTNLSGQAGLFQILVVAMQDPF